MRKNIKAKIRCDDDTPYVPHAAKWGVSLIPFANTSILAHLVAKRRMGQRILVDGNAIELELKCIGQFSGALREKNAVLVFAPLVRDIDGRTRLSRRDELVWQGQIRNGVASVS